MLTILLLGCSTTSPSALLSTSDEPPGDNCPGGGVAVASGVDDNADGTLGDDEIDHTVYICDGEDGATGEGGIDGADSLVATASEPPGANCEFGGMRVDSGIDDDGDGVLDAEEIDATEYVCDGAPGGVSLVSVTEEPMGSNCTYGGLRVDSGADADGDGALSASEVTSTSYVCNGDMGVDGASALAVSSTEPPGSNCTDGGVAVEVGTDDDGDGVLSATEVDTTFYVCDGEDGGGGSSIGTIVAGDYTVANSVDAGLLDGVEQITGLLTINGESMGDVELPDLQRVGTLYVGNTGTGFTPTSLSLPALTTVDDSLSIYKTEVADWSGFDSVTTVGGGLAVYAPEGASTINLFAGLTSIGGDVTIVATSENGVSEIAGLDAVTAMPGSLTVMITGNTTSSTRISAFSGLTSVGALTIYGDDWLTDVSGFGALADITGLLYVSNAAIPDFTDFASLGTAGGVYVSDVDTLTDMSGLEALTSLGVGLSVHGSDGMVDLTGLDNVASMALVTLVGNTGMTSLSGLGSVETVPGRIYLYGLPIADVDGLAALTSLGALTLYENDSLADLSGLGGVTGTIAPLVINSNAALTTLDGLEGVTGLGYATSADSSSYSLVVYNNASLADLDGLSGVSTLGYGIMYLELNPSLCASAVTAFRALVGSGLETWSTGSNKGC